MSETHLSPCPCGSRKPFQDCCEPFLNGEKFPETPEQLMRSRYSAYATLNTAYILETTHPKTRKYYSAKAIREWAEQSTWIGLEVLEAKDNTVKFVAHYLDAEKIPQQHREYSMFKQEGGHWYFVDGTDFS